jgi:hypothetical protein
VLRKKVSDGGGGGSGWPSDSIVADWKFNGDTTDSSGNGNNATASGTTSFVADESGTASHAIHLNGTTGFVAANSTSVGNFTSGDFSVVMYLTNNAANFSGSPIIWGNGTVGGNGYLFQEKLAAGGGSDAAHMIFFYHDGAGDHQITTADRAVSIRLNLCLVFVRSGTSGKIYLNGTDITAASPPTIGTIATSSTAFTMGKYLGGGFFLNANIQQVLIFSRALTPTEVATGSATASQ